MYHNAPKYYVSFFLLFCTNTLLTSISRIAGDAGDVEPRGLELDLAHPININLVVFSRTAHFRLVANRDIQEPMESPYDSDNLNNPSLYQNASDQDLHKRFQSLSLLLTFFSALEDENLTATLDSAEVVKERMNRLSTTGPTRVIDAALTLLVRDNENLAGMSYKNPTDSPIRPSTSIAVTHALPEGISVQDSDKVDNGDIPTPPYESDESKSLTFAAIPNPASESNDDHPSQNQVPTLPFVINDGVDHWDSISKDENFIYTHL